MCGAVDMMDEAFVRFPSVALRSMEDFTRFQTEKSAVLDARYRRELELASENTELPLEGSCALCLTSMVFVSRTMHGEVAPNGKLIPNWREEQLCGCRHKLNNRQRAVLHFLLPRLGAPTWYRAAVVGQPDAASNYLSQILPELKIIAPTVSTSGSSSLCLSDRTAHYHLLLSSEFLHRVPSLDAALEECARILSPGGTFVFTVPFSYHSASTISDFGGFSGGPRGMPGFLGFPVHKIGWDIIDRVRQAGFVHCSALCYWSEEFGYLGPYNIIFFASK
jgi:SAM-dependent methyltransferase